MKRTHMAVLGGGAAAVAAALWYARATPPDVLPRVDLPQAKTSGPAMCPWRDPKGDLKVLFPATPAATYRTDTLALSRIRLKILDRLGPGGRLEDNSLYVHRVRQGGKTIGSVLVRRAAGPYGAIEVVCGIGHDGAVRGVRIQRHREPEATAQFITSSAWLKAFAGKDASSPLAPGRDLPSPPAGAEAAANTVAAAVRSMLIEREEADKLYHGTTPSHH